MRRSLTRFDVTCIGLNAIVGSGIFLLPDDLYREMGVLSPPAFLLCAVGPLPLALCYSAGVWRRRGAEPLRSQRRPLRLCHGGVRFPHRVRRGLDVPRERGVLVRRGSV